MTVPDSSEAEGKTVQHGVRLPHHKQGPVQPDLGFPLCRLEAARMDRHIWLCQLASEVASAQQGLVKAACKQL